MKPFRYIGRGSAKEKCDDCEEVKILRVYETTSGYLRLCPSCGHQMEDDFKIEKTGILDKGMVLYA